MTTQAAQPERMSLAPLRKQLGVGLALLGFGAVFGVLGMFSMSRSVPVGISFFVLAAVCGPIGVMRVMRLAGDSRFDPSDPIHKPFHSDDR